MRGAANKNLVLAAMVFAVAMTFIDQTIVAIAIPQHPEGAVAVGDRLAVGHQRVSAGAVGAVRVRRQARRRARPPADGGDRRGRLRRRVGAVRVHAEGLASPQRVDHHLPRRPGCDRGADVPGRRSASSSPRSRCASAAGRWRSSSGSRGGLTAIGPIAGGYLTQWTWRAIFWINIPVAIIALRLDLAVVPRDRVSAGEARLSRHGADHRRRWG